MCIPRFDSGFVFGRLIDSKSGFFEIRPADEGVAVWRQKYVADSAVLRSECAVRGGGAPVFSVTDYMPWGRRELRRLITPGAAGAKVVLELLPTFDYRRSPHSWRRSEAVVGGDLHVLFTASAGTDSLRVYAPASAVEGGVKCAAGESACGGISLLLNVNEDVEIITVYSTSGEDAYAPAPGGAEAVRAEVERWKRWLSVSEYDGVHEDAFRRSLITMKTLTYERSGAILAAGTTSIPQHPGSGSNWDYRFSWIRDGSYTAAAYAEAGYIDEAKAFMDYAFRVMNRAPGGKPWQPLYRIDGDPDCAEEILEHLDGFMGDRPVRIGNLAYQQNQTDLEGEVLEALWVIYEKTRDADYLAKHYESVREVASFVTRNWAGKDNGIWELRGVITHYTHSKAMCWSAMDRASRIAGVLGGEAEADAWRATADAIKRDVVRKGWKPLMGAFVFAYDCPFPDSCLLAIPLSGMFGPRHPKPVSMAKRFESEIVYDGLVARNILEPAPFLLVTYWMARYYALAGKPEKARRIIDATLEHTTDLGLFCEQALGGGDVPEPGVPIFARAAFEMLTMHNSPASLFSMAKSFYNFYTNRSMFKENTETPDVPPEKARMFKGNFPQVYSHEELVRTLMALKGKS